MNSDIEAIKQSNKSNGTGLCIQSAGIDQRKEARFDDRVMREFIPWRRVRLLAAYRL
jgi:hypothetical protein